MRIVAMRAREKTVETDFRIECRGGKWRGEKPVRAQARAGDFDEQRFHALHARGACDHYVPAVVTLGSSDL